MNWVKTTAWPILQRTIKGFSRDYGPRLAASLAYYAVFSIFPLVLLMITILGYWLRFRTGSGVGDEQALMSQLLDTIGSNVSPEVAEILATVLADVKTQAGTSAPIALVTTLLAASGVFVQLDNAFNTIWNLPPRETEGLVASVMKTVVERGKAFALVLVIGLLLVSSLVVSTVLQAVGKYAQDLPAGDLGWRVVTLAVAFGLNVLVFALLFYGLPRVRLRWSDVFPAAIVTALLWEVGKQILALYIGTNKYTASATVTAFIALLAWIYYASMIIFFGAELSQTITLRRQEAEARKQGLTKLPPPPDLPTVGLPPPQAAFREKASSAVVGAAAGVAGAALLALGGAVVGLAKVVRRR